MDDKPAACYIRFRAGKTWRTIEIVEGVILADYDVNGQLLGIELLSLHDADVPLSIEKEEDR